MCFLIYPLQPSQFSKVKSQRSDLKPIMHVCNPDSKTPCADPILRCWTNGQPTDKVKHPPTLIARKQDIPQPKPTPTPFKPSKPCHPYLISSERALQLSSTLWYHLCSVMIVPLALVIYDCHSFLSGYRSVPGPDPLPLRHYSLVLVVECFSFVAWAFAHCRCFLVDYWNLRGEGLCTLGVAVLPALLAQYSWWLSLLVAAAPPIDLIPQAHHLTECG